MIRTVLFDLDDTLYDFLASEDHALEGALLSAAIQPTPMIKARYSAINEAEWKKLELGLTTRDQLRIERFQMLFEELEIDADALAVSKHYEALLGGSAILVEGTVDLLEELYPNYRLALVTNGITTIQEGRLAAGPLKQYFEAIYISEQLGYTKPDPKFFDAVFQDLGIEDKREVVIIGDSLTSDIQGGIGAGIRTVWFNLRGKTNETAITPDYTVTRLLEIPALLASIE